MLNLRFDFRPVTFRAPNFSLSLAGRDMSLTIDAFEWFDVTAAKVHFDRKIATYDLSLGVDLPTLNEIGRDFANWLRAHVQAETLVQDDDGLWSWVDPQKP